MPYYNLSTRQALADIVAGLRVDRATDTLPASTTESIFTVATGNILLTGIVGEVTTIIQNQACNLHITSVPTTGSAVDIGANVDIDNLEAGGLLSITGTVADAMTKTNAGAVKWMACPLVIAPGVIQIHTSATNTGSIKWSLFYVPVEDGAYVEAA